MRLEGKVALVTGAAGGIGRAAAERFIREGARLAAVDLDPGSTAALEGAEEHAACDVTDAAAVALLFRSLEARFGRLDVLLNVVGGSGRARGDGPIDTCTDDGWDYTLDLNLRSVFLCCRAAIPLMRRSGGGSIVNLGSVLALGGHELFDSHAYAASKGAVLALTRAMAVRYASDRIRVNAICPGLIRTPMSRRAQETPAILEALSQLQPLTGTFGAPEDVAGAALFLGSDESGFITGAVLPVDGGWTAR